MQIKQTPTIPLCKKCPLTGRFEYNFELLNVLLSSLRLMWTEILSTSCEIIFSWLLEDTISDNSLWKMALLWVNELIHALKSDMKDCPFINFCSWKPHTSILKFIEACGATGCYGAWSRQWLVTSSAPSHCWVIISQTSRDISQWSLIQNTNNFIQEKHLTSHLQNGSYFVQAQMR